jgi:hypothetical protein
VLAVTPATRQLAGFAANRIWRGRGADDLRGPCLRTGGKVHSFGARHTMAEAEQLLAQAIERVAAAGGRNDRYRIEEINTEGLFEFPPLPKPRWLLFSRILVSPRVHTMWRPGA